MMSSSSGDSASSSGKKNRSEGKGRRYGFRLIIVAYYELRDSLQSASSAILKLVPPNADITISSYPLLEMRNRFGVQGATSSNGGTDEGSSEQLLLLVEHFRDFVMSTTTAAAAESAAAAVLWWYMGVPYHVMSQMVAAVAPLPQYLFNWDDPFVWSLPENEMELKASLFDCVFVSCEESTQWYLQHGAKRAVYLLPGFDPDVHFPSAEETPPPARAVDVNIEEVDVSICCTNFYKENSSNSYSSQLSPTRYEILRALAKHLDTHPGAFSVAVYGPSWLKSDFPEFYRGEVPYSRTREVFCRSKINICTHVVGDRVGYLSERVSLVLGSGGFLWMDKVPQNIVTEKEAMFIDPARPVPEQVLELLAAPPEMRLAKQAAGYALAMQRLTWYHWAAEIIKNVPGLLSHGGLLLERAAVPMMHASALITLGLLRHQRRRQLLSQKANPPLPTVAQQWRCSSVSSSSKNVKYLRLEYLKKRLKMARSYKIPLIAKMAAAAVSQQDIITSPYFLATFKKVCD